MITKNETIRAMVFIAQVNQDVLNVEKSGQSIDDELTRILSVMIDNLMDLLDTDSSVISNILYGILPPDDMEKAYEEFLWYL